LWRVEKPAVRPGETFVESFEKGLRVITAFDDQHTSMTLSEVAERTSLTRAATRRLLLTLVGLGYATLEGKQFSLTARVLRLGHAYLRASALPELAAPVLQRLSDALGESASLAVLDGLEVVYVARSAKQRIMSVNLGVGARLPALYTSLGRVLLASHPQRDALLAQAPLERHTARALTNRAKLREVLKDVAAKGHCVVDQELEAGLRSIAVPVADARGRVIAAMNVSAQANRVSLEELRTDVLPALLGAAAALERELPDGLVNKE
jgi:IclR family pca regulon transcriptional regulator